MAADDSLRSQVMRKLRITWDDPDTEARVTDHMASADAVLRAKIGIPDASFDFGDPGVENLLYLNYCYYAWNDAEDDFFANYEHDIAQARRKWEVIQFAAEKEGSS